MMSATRTGSIQERQQVPSIRVHGQVPVATSSTTADLARSRLYDSGWHGLKQVSCEEHEGAVVLRGRVPTFYLKQLAQVLAAQAPGVEELINRIEVASPGEESA